MSDEDFGAGMLRIEELILRVEEACSPESLPLVRELVSCLLDVHRSGLQALVAAIEEAGGAGGGVVRALATKPAVASLLLMHDLHPAPLGERVERALRDANDVSLGQAKATLLRLDVTHAQVSIAGSAAGADLLERTLERLLCEHAPDATLSVEKHVERVPVASPRLVPVERLRSKTGGVR